MIGWLLGALAIAVCWLMAWALCRMVARNDADEAHVNISRPMRVGGLEEPPDGEYDRIMRSVARMQAEQADQRERDDDRALADNLDL